MYRQPLARTGRQVRSNVGRSPTCDQSASFVLDLRSEAYAALGPVPADVDSVYVRVVTETDAGATRALNHFNKHAKGALVRAMAQSRPRVDDLAGFERWTAGAGWNGRAGAAGEWELVVASSHSSTVS